VSIVAVLLLAVGVADLARSVRTAQAWIPPLAGLVAVALASILADLHTVADLLLLVLVAALTTVWSALAERARRRERGEAAPLLVFGLGLAAVFALAGAASPAGGEVVRWLRWTDIPHLQDLSADRFLLLLGLVLVQLSTGNELVRLILVSVGAMKPGEQAQPSDSLRGGRLLGPLERLFILGLGLSGQLTAASLVIAAKGVIRFPELTARSGLAARTARGEGALQAEVSGVGINEVTEYFLVGSFVSWLVAMAGLALSLLA
jgi:hypothetical protein